MPQRPNLTIKNSIRDQRTKAQLTQPQVLAMLEKKGIKRSLAAYQKYEANDCQPSDVVATALAEIFGITKSELFTIYSE